MPAEVVIVGAGIAGIATAWALTERGVADVEIVDRRPPLTLTSNRPEANYRTWWPHPAMVDLATRSVEIIQDLTDDGAVIPMDRRGYLYISESEAGAEALGGIVARHPATRLSRASALDEKEVHRRWPHLSPTVLGGIFVANAGGLDTVALGRAMLERAQSRGVRVVKGEAKDLDAANGQLIVNAAGPYARRLARDLGWDLPIETVLRQKIVVRDRTGAVPRDSPFTITLDGRSVAWDAVERKRLASTQEGRLLVKTLPPGIHIKPDDTAGADALKIGWAWDQRPVEPTDDPQIPPDFPRMAQLGASSLIPALSPDLAVVDHEGGFYARTPDGRPLGCALSEQTFAVAGFAGFGAMMACAAGELAAALITGATVDAATAAAFDPHRFEDPTYAAAIKESKVVTGEL